MSTDRLVGRQESDPAALYCRYLNPNIKLKPIETAIKLYQEFCRNKMNCRIFYDQ